MDYLEKHTFFPVFNFINSIAVWAFIDDYTVSFKSIDFIWKHQERDGYRNEEGSRLGRVADIAAFDSAFTNPCKCHITGKHTIGGEFITC